MPTTPEGIGELIKKLRKERGLTQTELGEKMGIKKSTLSQYEKGSYKITLTALVQFAEALDADLNIDLKLK